VLSTFILGIFDTFLKNKAGALGNVVIFAPYSYDWDVTGFYVKD